MIKREIAGNHGRRASPLSLKIPRALEDLLHHFQPSFQLLQGINCGSQDLGLLSSDQIINTNHLHFTSHEGDVLHVHDQVLCSSKCDENRGNEEQGPL